MQEIIVPILLYGIIPFSIAFFIHNLTFNNKKYMLYFTSFTVIIAITQVVFKNIPMGTILSTAIVCLFFAIIFFKLKVLKSILLTALLLTTIMISDICVGIFCSIANLNINAVKDNLSLQLLVNLMSAVIIVSISYILRRIKFFNIFSQDDSKSSFVYFLAPIFTSTLFGLSIPTIVSSNEPSSQSLYLIICISTLLCLYVFSFTMLHLNYNSEFKDYELKTKNEELEKMQLYTNIIENLYTEMRQFKHDYKNIISSIDGYLEENQIEELKDFFYNNIMTEKRNINNLELLISLNKLKSAGLKGVISSKLNTIEKNKIHLTIDIPEEISCLEIEEYDICKIVGILIDNAIEATVEAENKEVTIGIIEMDKCTVIAISNTFSKIAPINKMFEKDFSTKGENRGLGLHYVRNLIDKKYSNILLNSFVDKNKFIQEINITKK